jgi:aminoglycoside phosphotransferase (APT) family kinase protein
VLKLLREGFPPDLIEQEARITRLVSQAGMRTPRVGGIICVNGRCGLLYERVDGITMLEGLRRNLLKLIPYAHRLAELHAEMHTHCGAGLPSQQALLRRNIEAAHSLPDDLKRRVLQRLDSLPDDDRLCHGDFHPQNVMLTPAGPIVIDWESATCGSACADVARSSMTMTMAEPGRSAARPLLLALARLYHASYLRRYQQRAPGTPRDFRAWRTVQAAYRLCSEFPGERERLLRIIEQGL